jgi:uncharacterized protein
MSLNENIENKLNALIAFLEGYKIIVAFSGGVDSSLLAYLAKKYSKDMVAITVDSILNPGDDVSEAKKFAELYKVPQIIITKEPLKNKAFVHNPKNRCYICKKDIFTSILKIKDEKGFDIIIDGSNTDDLGDYRPGLQALNEMNIISPYIKCNINKQEIREVSNHFNLPTHSKPSGACLASRIPYNEEITEKKLLMIKQAEQFLRETYNLEQLRVRLHEGYLARIELMPQDLINIITKHNLTIITQELKNFGFCYITIDLQGFRSGSLNEVIDANSN